jgi:hypothetical protein
MRGCQAIPGYSLLHADLSDLLTEPLTDPSISTQPDSAHRPASPASPRWVWPRLGLFLPNGLRPVIASVTAGSSQPDPGLDFNRAEDCCSGDDSERPLDLELSFRRSIRQTCFRFQDSDHLQIRNESVQFIVKVRRQDAKLLTLKSSKPRKR